MDAMCDNDNNDSIDYDYCNWNVFLSTYNWLYTMLEENQQLSSETM